MPGLDRFEARKNVVAELRAAGPAGQDRGPHHAARPLLALRHRRRAADLQAVVRQDDAAGDAGARRGQVRPDAHRPGALQQDLHRLAGEHPRLVHLAPALVGPPHPGLVLRRLRRRSPSAARIPTACAALRQRSDSTRTPTCWIPGSARGSGRSARWAGRTTRPTCALLSHLA